MNYYFAYYLAYRCILHISAYLYAYSAYFAYTSGILYPWTGLGKMVRTGTYQYVPVQDSTGQYKNFQFVHTGMYQYIPVRTVLRSPVVSNPERVRRDEIRVIHRLCMGYNVTWSNFKTAQVLLSTSTYQYIQVYTGTYC